MRRAFLILLAISQIGAARHPSYGRESSNPPAVSAGVISIAAHPSEYSGRRLKVGGFLCLEFERAALYLDRSSFESGDRANAILVEKPKDLDRKLATRLSRRYALVEGTFVSGKDQIEYGYAGALTDIKLIRASMTSDDYYTSLDDSFTGWMLADKRFWVLLIATFAIPGFIYFRMMRRRKD